MEERCKSVDLEMSRSKDMYDYVITQKRKMGIRGDDSG